MKTLITMAILLIYGNAYSELMFGTDTLKSNNNQIDFSLPDSLIEPDLIYVILYPGGHYFESSEEGGILDMGEITMDEVNTAPDSGYVDHISTPMEFHVFCLETAEGHYVKFRVTVITGALVIEWVYQDNGTRNFSDVPVSQKYRGTSWGSVKKYI